MILSRDYQFDTERRALAPDDRYYLATYICRVTGSGNSLEGIEWQLQRATQLSGTPRLISMT